MIVSIEEAIRLTGKGRSTIFRHIKNGLISKSSDGSGIDVSELLRFYGSLKNNSKVSNGTNLDTSMNCRETWLVSQLEILQRELREQRDEHRKMLNEYREREYRLLALLEHQEVAVKAPNKSKSNNGLWQKIFKKSLK